MMRKLFGILVMALLAVPFGVEARNGHAEWGLVVKDLTGKRVVVNENGSVKMTPASTMKLFTTATALEILGPAYRIETGIWTDGKIDERGVLNGNLYIKGGLDPTIESSAIGNYGFFDSVAVALYGLGIKKVNGDIIADGNIIYGDEASPKWVLEDLATYYGVGCFGLSVYDNVQNVTVKAVDKNGKLSVKAQYPGAEINVINKLRIVGSSDAVVYTYSIPYGKEVLLEGTLGVGVTKYLRLAITNPNEVVAKTLLSKLGSRGIAVDGDARESRWTSYEGCNKLYAYYSPFLLNIIKEINFNSNNHYAQHIFRLLGTQVHTRNATLKDSENVVKSYWKRKGINIDEMAIYDGNGLSPMDALSPEVMVSMLEYMYHSKSAFSFMSSLPECGVEGTVKAIFRGKDFYARAKSGSMSGVQAYAGYVNYKNRIFAFCVIVNEFDEERSKVKMMIEQRLINAIKGYEASLQGDRLDVNVSEE